MKSSATFDPTSVAAWHNVLQNAAKVPQSSPDYADARAVMHLASDSIGKLNSDANMAGAVPGPTTDPGAAKAALVGAGQGASSGFADEIVGTMMALQGGHRTPGSREWWLGQLGGAQDPPVNVGGNIDAVRQQFSDARMSHPLAAFAGNVGGAFVSPLKYLLGPLTQGLKPAATGAVYGGTLAGAQGVGEGDNPQERVAGGVAGVAIGGTTGGAGGWLVGKVGPPAKIMWNNLRGAFGRTEQAVSKTLAGETAQTIQTVQEAAHRAYLQKQGFAPPIIDQLMETWKAGGKLPVAPPKAPTVETPVTMRPGETITQTSPRGFEVNGVRETPPAPTAPSLLEMQQGYSRAPTDLGKGQTLPYYPRGGQVEQGTSPYPVNGMRPLGPNQNQAFIEFLRGAHTPEEALARVATVKALNPQTDEAALLQMLGVQ